MKKENIAYWQTSRGQRIDAFEDVSCIVFRDEEWGGEIVATNVPSAYAPVGESFWTLAELTCAKVKRLRERLQDPVAMWVVSALGVGVLFSHFYHWIGCYVYLHIHDDPAVVIDFIANGAADKDIQLCPFGMKRVRSKMDTYDAEIHVRIRHRLMAMRRAQYTFCCAQDFYLMPGQNMDAALRQLANVLNVKLSVGDPQSVFAYGACGYDNLMTRFLWLCWLSWLHTLSVDGEIKAEFYPYPAHPLGVFCLRLKTEFPSVEQLRQRGDMEEILSAMDLLVDKGKRYDLTTDISWDTKGGLFAVDIQCIHLPTLFEPTDSKDPLLVLCVSDVE